MCYSHGKATYGVCETFIDYMCNKRVWINMVEFEWESEIKHSATLPVNGLLFASKIS